ncbi:MAG TPA: hypothetical protein VFA70_03705 [Dehalococcoidia bacterium]|nr:hypothetical protein [Dehalococcoidia bacterium]
MPGLRSIAYFQHNQARGKVRAGTPARLALLADARQFGTHGCADAAHHLLRTAATEAPLEAAPRT